MKNLTVGSGNVAGVAISPHSTYTTHNKQLNTCGNIYLVNISPYITFCGTTPQKLSKIVELTKTFTCFRLYKFPPDKYKYD
jgi:hypothetical protein